MKVYWYIEGDSPDKSFFKYGKRKPSDGWCMFSTLLGAYRHAYKQLLKYEEIELLDDNSSFEDYERVLNEWKFLDLGGGSGPDIIEIEVWE
jgi:hypothetical protein